MGLWGFGKKLMTGDIDLLDDVLIPRAKKKIQATREGMARKKDEIRLELYANGTITEMPKSVIERIEAEQKKAIETQAEEERVLRTEKVRREAESFKEPSPRYSSPAFEEMYDSVNDTIVEERHRTERSDRITDEGRMVSYQRKNKVILPLRLENGATEKMELNNIVQFSNQNITIGGSQGSGKTVAIKSVVSSYRDTVNPKIIIIDYKDDYSRESSYSEKINAKAVLVDREPIPLNPLMATKSDTNPIRDVSYRFVDLISTSYPVMGGNQRDILLTFTTSYLELCKNESSTPNIHGLFDFMNENIPDRGYGAWFTDVFRPLVDFNIFSCGAESMDNIFSSNENLVVNVAQSSEEHQLLITLLIISLLKRHMETNPKAKTVGSNRIIQSLLVVDEASLLMRVSNNTDFKKFIEKSRQYGYPFILGFQALSELNSNKSIDWEAMVSMKMQGYSLKKGSSTNSFVVGEFLIESTAYKGKYKVMASPDALD